MTKEEAKQWLRSQINSCIKIPHENFKDIYFLSYNKSYLRVLKLSKITGQPVNKDNFNSGVELFWFNTSYKNFFYSQPIRDYLNENYSNNHHEHVKIVVEVFNEYEEYEEYKDYTHC